MMAEDICEECNVDVAANVPFECEACGQFWPELRFRD